jgi:hypothetical protein
MSNVNYLATKRDVIEAYPIESIVPIRMPIMHVIQEAENLCHWAKKGLPQLASVNITANSLDELNARSGACRETQSLWINNQKLGTEAQNKWNEASPEAYNLRDELIHTFRYAFRANEKLLAHVNLIAESNGHDDMIQDLNDLSVLGKKNKGLLTVINFDLKKLNLAASLSSDMADNLAVANGSKQTSDESKVLRDKAYFYLKELVDEIRAAGKFLFWKNPERLRGYSSDYWRKKNSTKKQEDTAEVNA